MAPNKALRSAGARLAYGLPLLVAAAFISVVPDRPIGMAAVFAFLCSYAKLAGLAMGGLTTDDRTNEERLLLMETLPFFAYAAAILGRRAPLDVLFTAAGALLAGAALVSVDELLPRRRGLVAILGFIAAACGVGIVLETLPAMASIGPAALLLVASRYIAARRLDRRAS